MPISYTIHDIVYFMTLTVKLQDFFQEQKIFLLRRMSISKQYVLGC